MNNNQEQYVSNFLNNSLFEKHELIPFFILAQNRNLFFIINKENNINQYLEKIKHKKPVEPNHFLAKFKLIYLDKNSVKFYDFEKNHKNFNPKDSLIKLPSLVNPKKIDILCKDLLLDYIQTKEHKNFHLYLTVNLLNISDISTHRKLNNFLLPLFNTIEKSIENIDEKYEKLIKFNNIIKTILDNITVTEDDLKDIFLKMKLLLIDYKTQIIIKNKNNVITDKYY